MSFLFGMRDLKARPEQCEGMKQSGGLFHRAWESPWIPRRIQQDVDWNPFEICLHLIGKKQIKSRLAASIIDGALLIAAISNGCARRRVQRANAEGALGSKPAKGLTTPPSRCTAAHLPLHRGGFGAVQLSLPSFASSISHAKMIY